MSIFSSGGSILAAPDDNITFGSSVAARPLPAVSEDNDTFVVTDTGDANGVASEIWKFDKELGVWVDVDLDTDISAVNASLAGTNLTVAVTEDGNTLTSTADLSALLDDTDISAVDLAFAGGTLTMSVTEDGVTLTDSVPMESDTDVSDVEIQAGPTSTPTDPTIQVVVTEDGVDYPSNEWPVAPVCPAPMTRAALRALRTAGNLNKDCHYVVTDYSRGTVGAATILMHAVDANTLNMEVDVKTGFDAIAWSGRYDIDTNRLLELNDQLGNKVTGQEIVDTFPWGDTAVYDNMIEEGATLTYTDGAFFDNTLRTGAIVVVNNTGAGQFARNVIGEDSNVSWTAGDFRDNVIGTDGVVNHASTGDFDNNRVDSFGRVDTSGTSNVDQVHVKSNSRLTISGGSLAQSTIMGESSLTLTAGTNYDVTLDNSSTVNQVGTGYIRATRVEAESTLTVGNVNLLDNVFQRTTMNTTGAVGNIRYNHFQRATINALNVPSLTLDSCSFSANSQMTVSNATRTYVRYTTMSGFGRILQSAGTQLDMNYDGIRDYAYVQVLNGRLYSQYNSISNVSYIQQNTAGTNRAERNHISAQAFVRFIGTSNNCRVYYCDVSSGSNIYHNGTSTGCYFYYCQVSSSSTMYSNNSVNLRAYYNAASGNSQYYSQNVTATHYAYYNVMSAHGYIRHYNSTGGRIYAVHCHGQGLLNLVGATPAGRIYYSSFTAYYYLTASNWTITRTSLHGYGRQSYTVTNPPNGTPLRNF